MSERLPYNQVIEVVYVWALDDARFAEGHNRGQNIVSEPDFWRRLHVKRRVLSKQLRNTLFHAHAPVYLVGPRGQGKTTLALDAGRKFAKCGHLVLYVDFRHDPRFSDIIYMERESLARLLPKKISDRLKSILEDGSWRNEISRSAVLEYLLGRAGGELDSELSDLRDKFIARREVQMPAARGSSFAEWLHSLNEYDPSGIIRDLKEAALTSISARDYLLAADGLGQGGGVLIIFDNVDSIGASGARDALRDYLHSVDKHLGPVPRILINIRDENYSGAHFDQGGASLQYINIRDYDAMDGVGAGSADQPSFDERVTQARFLFVGDLVAKRQVDLGDGKLAEKLEVLQREFLRVGHVENTLSRTSNGNRRRLFATLSNFIENFYLKLDPEFSSLFELEAQSLPRMREVIETQLIYFLMGAAKTVPAPMYDLVRWIADYKSGRVETPAVLANHYVLTRLCRATAGKPVRESRITAQEVLLPCEEIGLSRAEVMAVLKEFASGHSDESELIESSRQLRDDEEVTPQHQFEVLTRARYLASVGSRKVCYAVHLLHQAGRLPFFSPTDLAPFSPAVLAEVLALLAELAEMELWSLISIREKLRAAYGRDWYEQFGQTFGCFTEAADPKSALLTQSLLYSYLKYFASTKADYGNQGDSVIGSFQFLERAFGARAEMVRDNVNVKVEHLELASIFRSSKEDRWRQLPAWQ